MDNDTVSRMMTFIRRRFLLRECSAAGMIRSTAKARRVIFYAYNEAVRNGDHEISLIHLLLGILTVDEHLISWPARALQEGIRETLCKTELRWGSLHPISLSSTAQQAISFAATERELLGHKHTGTEHLLLGISRGNSRASQLLRDYGFTYERLLRLLRPRSHAVERTLPCSVTPIVDAV